jgi:hypothetical protein
MNQGSNIAHNKEVADLVILNGYVTQNTYDDASRQNALEERPRQIIGTTLCTTSRRAGIPFKYWFYAFNYCFIPFNVLSHHDTQGMSTVCLGDKRSNIYDLRTFDCCVFVPDLPSQHPTRHQHE